MQELFGFGCEGGEASVRTSSRGRGRTRPAIQSSSPPCPELSEPESSEPPDPDDPPELPDELEPELPELSELPDLSSEPPAPELPSSLWRPSSQFGSDMCSGSRQRSELWSDEAVGDGVDRSWSCPDRSSSLLWSWTAWRSRAAARLGGGASGPTDTKYEAKAKARGARSAQRTSRTNLTLVMGADYRRSGQRISNPWLRNGRPREGDLDSRAVAVRQVNAPTPSPHQLRRDR